MAASPSSTSLTPTQAIVAALIVAHVLGALYWVLALARQSGAKKRD